MREKARGAGAPPQAALAAIDPGSATSTTVHPAPAAGAIGPASAARAIDPTATTIDPAAAPVDPAATSVDPAADRDDRPYGDAASSHCSSNGRAGPFAHAQKEEPPALNFLRFG